MSLKQNTIFYENLKELREENHEELIKKGLHTTYGCDECFHKWVKEMQEGLEELELQIDETNNRLNRLTQKLDKTDHLIKTTCLDGTTFYEHDDDCECPVCLNEIEEAIEGSSI